MAVENAIVRASVVVDGAAAAKPAASAVTDAYGAYRLDGLAPGRYAVTAIEQRPNAPPIHMAGIDWKTVDDLAPKTIAVDVAGGAPASADFPLDQGGRATVTVLTPEGKRERGQLVTLERSPLDPLEPRDLVPLRPLDEGGQAKFDQLEAETYVARATTSDGSRSAVSEPFRAESNRESTVVVRWPATHPLRVRCVGADGSAAAADSVVAVNDAGRTVATARAGADGRAELKVPRGKLKIVARAGTRSGSTEIAVGDAAADVVVNLGASDSRPK